MKKISLIFLILIFLTGCASLGVAEDQAVEPAQEIIGPPETSENPSFAQINQSKMDLLSWQLRFWKENQRAIELEYTGLIFKDARHQMAIKEVDRITKKIKQQLIQ